MAKKLISLIGCYLEKGRSCFSKRVINLNIYNAAMTNCSHRPFLAVDFCGLDSYERTLGKHGYHIHVMDINIEFSFNFIPVPVRDAVGSTHVPYACYEIGSVD